jgi:hypothetical protein
LGLVISDTSEAAFAPALSWTVAAPLALTLELEMVAEPVQAAIRNADESSKARIFIC